MSFSADDQDEFENLDNVFEEFCAREDAARAIPPACQRVIEELDALLLETEDAGSSDQVEVADDAEIALPSASEIALSPASEIALPSIGKIEPQPKASLGFPDSDPEACPVVPPYTPPNNLSALSLDPSAIPSVDRIVLTSGDEETGIAAPTVRAEKGGRSGRKKEAAKKFARAIDIAGRHSGLAFTLNLGVGVEGTLHRSADPARIISDRMNRAFKDAGVAAPRYAFSIEISPENRVHVHGVIIVADPEQQQQTKSPLRRALAKAGGKIEGRAASRQVNLKSITDAEGWFRYICVDESRASKTLETDKLKFLSSSLRREVNYVQYADDHWTENRY